MFTENVKDKLTEAGLKAVGALPDNAVLFADDELLELERKVAKEKNRTSFWEGSPGLAFFIGAAIGMGAGYKLSK